ncbi:MAG TPA: ferritin-like domain-containing protein [Puia sp.]|nr:ferritin-like domain-containing protein [Puia sp.]
MPTTQTAPVREPQKNSKLRQFFVGQLQDIYWAEQKLVTSIAKLEDAAHAPELKQAFNSHLQETKNHVSRLEKVFQLVGESATAKKCQAIAGITDEAEEIIDETEEGTAQRDVGLIFAGQKAEHYEIATYGGLVQLARTLGYSDAAEIMGVTLAEEKKADNLLTRIAADGINVHASEEVNED